MVENPLAKWVDLLPNGPFPQKLNILGAITAERYGHRFISVSRGYIPAYFLSKR
jgi:hypothetical protein